MAPPGGRGWGSTVPGRRGLGDHPLQICMIFEVWLMYGPLQIRAEFLVWLAPIRAHTRVLIRWRARGIVAGMGMDLDLDLGDLSRSGRRAKPLTVGEVRPIRSSDLALLAIEGETKAPAIKRISERHHRLARLLADGMAPAEASLATGYCLSRISILQADPMFQELVSHYRTVQTDAYADLHTRLAGLSVSAADLLQERIEESPEELTVGQLKSLVEMGADRTGYGPQSTSVNLTANIADRMDAARRRAREKRMKDVTPTDKENEDERSSVACLPDRGPEGTRTE